MNRSEDESLGIEAPLVTVVVVNYNGGSMVTQALESLRSQTFSDFETILVDNGSTDGSDRAIRRQFPEVRLIDSAENLGFSGGNNLGREHARGRFLALLNNDAVPEPDWLMKMIAVLEGDDRAAAVTSKLIFLMPFVAVELGPASGDEQEPRPAFEILIDEDSAFVDCDYRKPVFLRCPPSDRTGRSGRRLRRFGYESTLLLPVGDRQREAILKLVVAAPRSIEPRTVTVSIAGHEIGRLHPGDSLSEAVLEVPEAVIRAAAHDLINNAGTDLHADGGTLDRGIYEPVGENHEEAREVDAICGAAALLRCSAIEEVGLFDRHFFMYFEDTDLSWRLRSSGYHILYEPTARVRHHHAATSVELSPAFRFYTARNRILMLVKNGTGGAAMKAYLQELRRCVGSLARSILSRSDSQPAGPWAELGLRLRIQASLAIQVPRALLKRMGLLKH